MSDSYALTERTVMLALMAEARPLTNTELRALGVPGLEGAARRRLNDAKLVESVKQGRSFRHDLTDDGWAWCAREIHGDAPPRSGSAGGALYAVLRAAARYLARADVPLSEFCRPDGEHLVLAAYAAAAGHPGAWVRLADLREGLPEVPSAEVDGVLRAMMGRPGISLVPESNQKSLTDRDRAAAVVIGGEEIHAMAVRWAGGTGRRIGP